MRQYGSIRHAISRAALTTLLICAAQHAVACGGYSYPAEMVREFNETQVAEEREFIARTIAGADTIAIVEVVRSDVLGYEDLSDANVTFRTERAIKGKVPETFSAVWYRADKRREQREREDKEARRAEAEARGEIALDTVHYSCWPKENFDAIDFSYMEDYRFLVYLREGRVLRASPFRLGPPAITPEQEILMISGGKP